MTTRMEPRHGEQSLEEAAIHDVLRNSRRRLVLERLAAEDTQTVSDLAEHIAAVEAGEDPPPRNVRQSVYVSLHQTHLPKLHSLGIATYDANEKLVTRDAKAEDVDVYMEVVPESGLSWAEYYFGFSLVGLATMTGHRVGVPMLSDVDATLLGGGLLLVLCLSAGYHLLYQRRLAVSGVE